ncbi:hypothetical protein KSS87_021654 [Heliosperma pusillum]|nr:hypothetical protein KSS87_021654 [Heliosperma pusillum]
MSSNDQHFQIQEATITSIQQAFSQNKLTSTQLVDLYLNQIETLNPILRAVVEVNPDARDIAKRADQDRHNSSENGIKLGALHGIPVLLKDTIGTNDKLGTTAGSYALVGSKVARDATVVEKLRLAGAVILGKASLSEWYKISGSAISVAANLVTVSLGTDTHSSIISPSDHNSVVGIRPTVGLVSRAGVIPISSRQDTVGPICRTVSDCVFVLDVIVGPDTRDEEATLRSSRYIPRGGYAQFLNKDGLKGKKLGIVRHPFVSSIHGSIAAETFEYHLDILRERGAILVDNLEILNAEEILNPHQSGEITAMIADFKHSIGNYLNELESSPVKTLADIIAFNEKNAELEKTNEYGQDDFIKAENMQGNDEEIDKIVEHLDNLNKEGFEKMMEENELDAMVTPGTKAIPIMAIGGYPGITVPAGYDEHGIPFGMLFSGLKGTEPKLIEIAYGFEQATLARELPLFNAPEWHVDN